VAWKIKDEDGLKKSVLAGWRSFFFLVILSYPLLLFRLALCAGVFSLFLWTFGVWRLALDYTLLFQF
jgi:hypothetical protein